ncbi:MAG: hypothetical protein FJZ60_00225 [Chlamydiae bacterium]|nr:hypothetical protein [Chlamydiota bacterium]
MSSRVVKESEIRKVIKTLLEDKTLGPKMVKVNPVVDQSAALTDPANQNYKPSSKSELTIALSALIHDLSDESVPGIYDAVKNAIDDRSDAEGKEQMKKSNEKLESLRRTIRAIIKEALPVSPPPPMPQRRVLPALPPIDSDLEDLINTPGTTRADIVKFLKAKNPKLKGPEAIEQAQGYMKLIQGPKDLAAREKFLSGVESGEKQVTKLPSKYKPLWPESGYSPEAKKASPAALSKAEKEINKQLYVTNFEEFNHLGVDFNLAADAYYDAYAKTMAELGGNDPQAVVDSKEFDTFFKDYLKSEGIKNPPTVKDIRSKIGYEAVIVLGEKLQKEKEEVEADIDYMEKKSASEPDESMTGRQNISDVAVSTLKQTADALGISIGMIKKIEAQALGKYVLGIKSEIFELMPDDIAS